MPRMFYKIVVGAFFGIMLLALLAVEVALSLWIVDHYPKPWAWVAWIIFSLVDIPLLLSYSDFVGRMIRQA